MDKTAFINSQKNDLYQKLHHKHCKISRSFVRMNSWTNYVTRYPPKKKKMEERKIKTHNLFRKFEKEASILYHYTPDTPDSKIENNLFLPLRVTKSWTTLCSHDVVDQWSSSVHRRNKEASLHVVGNV